MKTNRITRKMISILLCMALLFSYLPIATLAATEDAAGYNRVVDENTMDNWVNYFDLEKWGTANAGGVWTDKSVFTNADAFDGKVSMIDDSRNFLTALSAISANKEIVGYSTVPTDTVFVLDLSNSMSDDDIDDLVASTNKAITDLLAINNNNRVGVILYSGSSEDRTYGNAVATLMPIDRYTTTKTTTVTLNNEEITVGAYIEKGNGGEKGTIRLARQGYNSLAVSGSGESIETESKQVGGATYIQAGLWEAYKAFDAVPDDDIVIGENNWQSGDYRMPILVLMSDGAPTLGTSYFDDVENSDYGSGNENDSKANAGNGNDTNITAGQGFLVQLTAAYVKNRIENKYKVHTDKGAGKSLFYTLGFNITADNDNYVESGDVAYSVLNPEASTITDSLWETYGKSNSMQVSTKGRNNRNNNEYINVTVYKNSYASSKLYVDEYFEASGEGLINAFNSIVEEIIIQSRYYPTHLEGGSPDFVGYVEFTDTLGEYMEVKAINGILLGDTLFDGHMMASKLLDNSADGLGTVETPTALGDEFIRAVKTRLGITETADAQQLVAKAFADGQLAYTDENNWSNYIMWYAKADGSYAGFCDKDGTETVPADAVYINRSYGFLGETSGSIKNSDMMYMSVQVHENIETGEQSVIWKIPAALVPMITYKVTLKGTTPETATDVNVTVEEATPVRLIYETGLRSDLNEFNITKISGENIATSTKLNDERHLAADGHTRLFWNNSFDISGEDHDKHVVALSEFTPNKDNERFYFTFDSAVYKKNGDNYEIVAEGELDPNGEYYHRRFNFINYPEGTAAENKQTVFTYEKMSAASVAAAVWKDDFELLDHSHTGAYVVAKGTPARELQMFNEKKDVNATNSAEMVFHPYLTEQNNTFYVDMNLGNNGLLSVTPATGIKISKTIDIYETGTSDTFKFRVTLSENGSFDSWITALDATPEGEATTATFTDGVYEFEMKKDQTFWLSGVPAGTTYLVEEISDNEDYKIKSVHVDGVSTGTVADGNIRQYYINDIDFVNTAVGEGDLVITKQVVDANGNTVDVNDNIEFTLEVALTNAEGEPVEPKDSTVDVGSDGKFTIKLSDGESFVVRGIPEETRYTVTETNIPNGFVLNTDRSELTGVVDATANDQALVVNTYAPTGTDGAAVSVDVTKTISGNRTDWRDGESYTFNLERVDITRASAVIDTDTISASDSDKKISFTLADEDYTAAGTYYYRITEEVGSQGGITYDTAAREFAVTVADADMDGDLEITSVTNIMNTVVSGSWTVAASFNNVYAPTGTAVATINIQKSINDNRSLAGFQFALYDSDPTVNADANEVTTSNITGSDGQATINLSFAANRATIEGAKYTYYLAEIEGTATNIDYSTKVYTVEVTVIDNGDGTVSAETKVYDGEDEVNEDEIPFTNVYVPSEVDYISFSGRKEISTNNRVLNANEFAFVLEALDGAPTPMNEILTVKNAADGSFSFAPIEFTTAGVYKYVITEDDSDRIGGFKYDAARYEITVTVTDSDRILTAEITDFVKVTDGSSEDATDIVFKNEYYTIADTLKLEGTKLLTGKTLRAGEFSFKIEALTENAPAVPGEQTITNNDDGSFDFATITFDKAGTYQYRITEVAGEDTRYSYDKSVYVVTVVVTDNSEGILTATHTIKKDGLDSAGIVFSNSFTPDPYTYDIDYEIGINKVLYGRDLNEGEFEFALINAISGEQIGETVKNDADGNIDFPALTMHEVGTYHYKVIEVGGDLRGVRYDTSAYHVVLGIEQIDENGSADDGQLKLVREELHIAVMTVEEVEGVPVESTEYFEVTGSPIVFNNEYIAEPALILLDGTKLLTGRELEAGEFIFNLWNAVYDEEADEWVKGEIIQQEANDANGAFSFVAGDIAVNQMIHFFITEDSTEPDETITYDATEYMVTVTSTDNLDGTLTVNYEYTVDGELAEEISFTNTYTAPEPEPDPDPNPDEPKTGDESNLLLWLALLVMSGAGISAVAFYDKRKKA